jgi:hypothetical protein
MHPDVTPCKLDVERQPLSIPSSRHTLTTPHFATLPRAVGSWRPVASCMARRRELPSEARSLPKGPVNSVAKMSRRV